MPPQPPANQLQVLGGVVVGLAFCALPFAFKDVRKTEAQARGPLRRPPRPALR
jgi:hypothetical protein